MAECGHCGKKVGGIRDHIKDVHGDKFYDFGPDFRYYSYRWLRENIPGIAAARPHWDATYDPPIVAAEIPDDLSKSEPRGILPL